MSTFPKGSRTRIKRKKVKKTSPAQRTKSKVVADRHTIARKKLAAKDLPLPEVVQEFQNWLNAYIREYERALGMALQQPVLRNAPNKRTRRAHRGQS